LKANASLVPSTIGGGLCSHLGLLISVDKYATLADATPWETPGHPGPFKPPAGGTAAQIEAAKDVWRQQHFTFALCQATSKALITQVVESINSLYLQALLNCTTGQYASNLHNVLQHLFSTYRHITPQQIKVKEIAICNMTHTIATCVDAVFNAIDNLVNLADHSNAPMTICQTVDLAYVVLSKEHSFHQDICAWNRRPSLEKTWPAMLAHFHEAQADLLSLPTAGNLYHYANAAIMVGLVAQRLLSALPSDVDSSTPLSETPTLDAANAVFQSCKTALATCKQLSSHK
jgi:hypothetical protein